jgi:hypothetical protein
LQNKITFSAVVDDAGEVIRELALAAHEDALLPDARRRLPRRRAAPGARPRRPALSAAGSRWPGRAAAAQAPAPSATRTTASKTATAAAGGRGGAEVVDWS